MSESGNDITKNKNGIKNVIITIATNLCRVILGLTFIFSGYVKSVDPLGTQYKISDYLEVMGILNYAPDWITLVLSILLSAFEFSLGIFMLFAIRRRLVSKLTFIFMVIMTIISLWLVLFDPVKDCGCFGDAIKITNPQTLAKNIILLACTLVVCRFPLSIVCFINKHKQWLAINYTILFILASTIYSLWNLPLFDFRPYHIGANMKEGMEIPEGAPKPVFETTFTMEKDGQRKDFSLENYPDSTWKFITSKTKTISEGYVPPIHDFSIEDTKTGEDITQDVLNDKNYSFLLVSPHLENADDSNFGDIDKIYEYAQDKGYKFYCLTASNEKGIKGWQDITGAEYPFYTTDETTLKTIIRSNPGLLLIKDGTIIRKWSHNELPDLDDESKPLSKSELGQLPSDTITQKILKILLWFFLPLFILAVSDRIIKRPSKKKEENTDYKDTNK